MWQLRLRFWPSAIRIREVVATCGAAEGQVYMTNADAVTLWTKDKVTGGSFQLLRSGTDDWDIVMTDSVGDTWSFKGAGAKILGLVAAEDVYVMLVLDSGGAYETYAFYLDSPKPEMVWTLARFGTGARKRRGLRGVVPQGKIARYGSGREE